MTSIRKVYHFKVARGLIWLLQKLKLLDKAVSQVEKAAVSRKEYRDARAFNNEYPQFLLPLLSAQLDSLEELQRVRKSMTSFWNKMLGNNYSGALLKYPIFRKSPDSFVKNARKQGLYLSRWYSNVIDPAGVDLKRYGYKKGSCPNAEYVAKRIVNLPTMDAGKLSN